MVHDIPLLYLLLFLSLSKDALESWANTSEMQFSERFHRQWLHPHASFDRLRMRHVREGCREVRQCRVSLFAVAPAPYRPA
ncbi:MAG: hypothetical protein OEN55_07795 [Alphaproteobacteria bacterium]|nr:hypothetical protein [Alphaproteobacteria bacterium]